MNVLHFITKVFTIEKFVHALLFCFAGASVGTISEFLLANAHNQLTSYGLAVALGGGLVAVSIMLAKTDMSDRQAFFGMLAGVIVVAVMSATLQVMAYHAHGQAWFTAAVLGIGFPLVECVLAVGVALHDAAEKRRRVMGVRDGIRQRISEAVGDSMRDIDVSKVRGHIEKRVDGIIRQQVDMVINQMGIAPTAMQPAQVAPEAANETAVSHDIAATGKPSVADMNLARQQAQADRQRAITELISSYGPLSTAEIVAKLAEDRNVQASERTVRSDCAALESAGQLVRDGRRWALQMTLIAALPTMAEPVLNGVAH